MYSLFILVLWIPFLCKSSPHDFVKFISKKEINCSRIILPGKLIIKVLSRAHMCSLEQRARIAHDQSEQTLPQFAPAKFLLKVSGLNYIKSEIDVKKLLFLGHLITEMKMASAVKSLFFSRVDSFF